METSPLANIKSLTSLDQVHQQTILNLHAEQAQSIKALVALQAKDLPSIRSQLQPASTPASSTTRAAPVTLTKMIP